MYSNKDISPTISVKPLAVARAVGLLSLLLAFSGCTTGPDFEEPYAELNEYWSEKGESQVITQTAVSEDWWTTFDDPAIDKLIHLAYQQNLSLQIAGLRIMEARAQLGIAIGQQYPQIQEAFGSATGVGISKNAANTFGIDRNYWDYQLGFDAVWELDFWGKFRRNVEATRAGLIASAADYDNALVSLTAEVARTYAVIRTFEATIELTRQNVALQEEGLKITESRFRNGVVTELDVTQARTLLESTKTDIPRLESGLRQSQNALSTLLGQPTGRIQALLEGPRVIPVAPAEVAVGVPVELLRRRPDIRSAELSAAAQCARFGIAKADIYPSFSLFGQIGLQTTSHGGVQSNNANFGNLMDSDSFFYSYGPAFNWPIFNYGRIENNVRVQDARFQQLLVNYQNTVLTAAQEVEDSLIAFLKAKEAEVSEQNSVDAARRSVELAMTQYRHGVVDYQRVLDTQRALLQEEIRLANTQSSIATNLIALYKALGGGWELRRGRPIIPESAIVQMQARTDWGNLLPPAPAPEDLNPPPPAHDIPLLQEPDW
jgi:NodT family efflux transporter outer membrane factor (OMF) lipoprotein